MKLSEDVSAISAKMQETSKLSVTGSEGVVTPSETIYADTLPEGLDMETVGKVADHNSNYIAAGKHAFGTMSINAMASNKKLDRTTGTFPMYGKDNVSFTTQREKTYTSKLDGTEKEYQHYGVMTNTLEVHGGLKGGQFTAVRNVLKDLAIEKLKK